MVENHWDFTLRQPRHQASATEGCEVRIERSPGKDPLVTSGRLIDLSRSGFKLRLPVSLEIGEPLTMQICDDRLTKDIALPGVVRWSRRGEQAGWLLGCQATDLADYETLGELFINDILSTDESPRE